MAHTDYTKLIEPFEKAVNDAEGRARITWITLISLIAYLFVAVTATTHKDLLLESPQKLPILQVDMPLFAFYIFVPLFIVIIHFMALAQGLVVQDAMGKYRVQLKALHLTFDEKQASESRLSSGFFIRAPNIPSRWELRLTQATIEIVTMRILPPLLLIYIQLQFLPYHSTPMTRWHRAMFVLDILMVLIVAYRAGTFVQNGLVRDVKAKWFRFSKWAFWGAASLSALAFSIGVAVQRDEWMPYPQVVAAVFDSEVDEILQKRKGLFSRDLVVMNFKAVTETDEQLKSKYFTYNFKGRDFQGANFSTSDFKNADFSFTSLQNVNFNYSNLSNVTFSSAKLNKANLSSANLVNVNLSAADLTLISMRSASIQYSNLKYSLLFFADLNNSEFIYSDLDNAQLILADFSEVLFYNSNLTNSSFIGSEFSNTIFFAININYSNFWRSKLFKSDKKFINCTDLYKAPLTNIQFQFLKERFINGQLSNAQIMEINKLNPSLEKFDSFENYEYFLSCKTYSDKLNGKEKSIFLESFYCFQLNAAKNMLNNFINNKFEFYSSTVFTEITVRKFLTNPECEDTRKKLPSDLLSNARQKARELGVVLK